MVCKFTIWVKGLLGRIGRMTLSILFRKGVDRMMSHGIELWCSPALCHDASRLLGCTTKALNLIEESDPIRWSRLSTSVHVVALASQRTLATYFLPLRISVIDPKIIDMQSDDGVEWLATVLIHESTHAYLRTKGIPWNNEYRKRIESICVKECICFRKRVAPSKIRWDAYFLNTLRNMD